MAQESTLPGIEEYGVPDHTQEALCRYLFDGLRPGGFLECVLTNDLYGAVQRADTANYQALAEIVVWILNHAPSESYGEPEQMNFWLSEHADDLRTQYKAKVAQNILCDSDN